MSTDDVIDRLIALDRDMRDLRTYIGECFTDLALGIGKARHPTPPPSEPARGTDALEYVMREDRWHLDRVTEEAQFKSTSADARTLDKAREQLAAIRARAASVPADARIEACAKQLDSLYLERLRLNVGPPLPSEIVAILRQHFASLARGKVVLPDTVPSPSDDKCEQGHCVPFHYARGWNECLDAVQRLNGGSGEGVT